MISLKYIFTTLLLIGLSANADIYKCPSPDGSISYTSIPCIKGAKKEKGKWENIESQKSQKTHEQTNILLKLTNAKSIDELMTARTAEMHKTLQYYDAYEKCERSLSVITYLFNNVERFKTDTKLAQTSWNEFADKKLRNLVENKLNALTKDNLKDKYKECKNSKKKKGLELKKLERRLIKDNPNFRGFNLDISRGKH